MAIRNPQTTYGPESVGGRDIIDELLYADISIFELLVPSLIYDSGNSIGHTIFVGQTGTTTGIHAKKACNSTRTLQEPALPQLVVVGSSQGHET